MSRLLRTALFWESSVADAVSSKHVARRRLEEVFRLASTRGFRTIALTVAYRLRYHYTIGGRVRDRRANDQYIEVTEPVWRKERDRRERRKRRKPNTPLPVIPYGLPPSPVRENIRSRIGRALLLEPARKRVRALTALCDEALDEGCDWEAYLAAFFAFCSSSLLSNADRVLPSARRRMQTLKRRAEVRRMSVSSSNPILHQQYLWRQEFGES